MSERLVYQFCLEMTSTRSTNAKKSILLNYSSSELICTLLSFLLDKSSTGITVNRLNKCDVLDTATVTTFKQVLEYLKKNNSGTDADISVVKGYLSLVEEEYRPTIQSILTRELKLGVDVKTVTQIIQLDSASKVMSDLTSITDVSMITDGWVCMAQHPGGTYALFDNGSVLTQDSAPIHVPEQTIRELNKLTSAFSGDIVVVGFIDDNGGFTVCDISRKASYYSSEGAATYKQRMRVCQDSASLVKSFSKVRIAHFIYAGSEKGKLHEYMQIHKNTSPHGFLFYDDGLCNAVSGGPKVLPTVKTEDFSVLSVALKSPSVAVVTVEMNKAECKFSCPADSEAISILLSKADVTSCTVSVEHRGAFSNNIASGYKLREAKIISVK